MDNKIELVNVYPDDTPFLVPKKVCDKVGGVAVYRAIVDNILERYNHSEYWDWELIEEMQKDMGFSGEQK